MSVHLQTKWLWVRVHLQSNKTIIGKLIEAWEDTGEKNEILVWRKIMLKTVKSSKVKSCQGRSKINIDPRRESFLQTLSIPEILAELKIADEEYYRALPTSNDDELEVHLKSKPNFCFVGIYFDDSLKAWQANMDIQPVFNKSKAVIYMCSFQKVKTSAHMLWGMQLRRHSRRICIITKQWKQSHKPISVNVNSLCRRQIITTSHN